MATTVQQILTAAYAKSIKNRPGEIATETTELLQVVNRELQGLFAEGVEHNRTFFAQEAVVAYSAPVGGWPRPDAAEAVIRIEAAGAEVAEVPFDDRTAESGMPAVYHMGQVFKPAGNAGDPTSGNLTFFYSARPRDLTALTGDPAGTLDPLWPEQFNELLILRIALYLAGKDGQRSDELQLYSAEYEAWRQRFIRFLQHSSTTLRQRWGHSGRTNTQRITPRGAA